MAFTSVVEHAGVAGFSSTAGYSGVSGALSGAVIRALFAGGQQGAWYDPSDFSTMYQTNTTATPVTAVGQTVGRIQDKSGRGNHMTQATVAARPTLQQDAQGFYYLDFDGVDDGMSVPGNVNFSAVSQIDWWLGIYRKGDAGLQQPFGLGGDVAGAFCLQVGSGVNLSRFFLRPASGGAVLRDSTAYPINTKYVYSDRLDQSVGGALSNAADVNLTSLAVATGAGAAGNFINSSFYIGFANGSRPANVRLYQVVCRGAASSALEFSNAKTFVNSKIGAY